jgi:anti-sigma factor RsiW
MKDCGNIRELLSPYLENELAPDELTRVKGHLGECAECRAELELLRMTVGALRDLPELPAPAGILMGVRESLKPRPWHEHLRSLIFPTAARRVPLGALASVLVAFGIFLIYDRFPEVGKRPVVAPPVEEVTSVTEKKDAPPVFLDEARPQGETVADAGKDTSGSLPADGNVSPALGVTGGIAREAEERTVESAVSDRPVTVPAPAASTAPPRQEVAKNVPAPEPVAPPAMEMSAGRKNVEVEAQGEAEAPDTREAGKSPRPKAEDSYDYYRSDRDASPPPKALKKKTAAGAAPAERAASFADQGVRARSKALPPAAGADDAVVGMLEGVAALRESGSALPESERARLRGDFTEVLTVVSLDGGEVDQIRESLRQAGGKMLELRALDALTSQQLALPHQKRIPPTQTISQGWQIRAAVPRSSVDDFVASLEGESSLQLLHRTSEPLTWSQERGLQNFEINLIR